VVMRPMMFAVAGAVFMMVPAVRYPGAGRLWLRRIRGTLRRGLRWRSGLLSGQSNYWRGCENEYD
jgi:hypothetical protein